MRLDFLLLGTYIPEDIDVHRALSQPFKRRLLNRPSSLNTLGYQNRGGNLAIPQMLRFPTISLQRNRVVRSFVPIYFLFQAILFVFYYVKIVDIMENWNEQI